MAMENKEKKTSGAATYTAEQQAAIAARGKTIVSASAGSGKTTVMIEKIIRFIADGGDVGEVLAVTFTKKAASQMKEKLRKALIKAINADGTGTDRRAVLKRQLDGVQSADISTIHSFCAKLLRTHFYAAGVDNAFRVINDEDAEGTALKNAAIDEVFEEGYEEKDEKFLHLLSVYWRKKSDNALRTLLLTAYKTLRNRADYRAYLERSGRYDEQTFDEVCNDLWELLRKKCAYYLEYAEELRAYFEAEGGDNALSVSKQLVEMLQNVLACDDYFRACVLRKEKFAVLRTSKKDSEEKRKQMKRLSVLKGKVVAIYDEELSITKTREEEKERFLTSAQTAAALADCLLKFDDKFSALKAERGALDYNDLEHKTLALLQNDEVASEIGNKYRYVFVDEYQDVNPVQEAILSRIGGENLFLVGDVKQSIYGFRGSKSKFFAEKQREFENGGNSLVMKRNFRSSDAVLDAVNAQFSLAMTPQTCNVNYAVDSYMERGGRYPLNGGKVQIHFIKEDEEKKDVLWDVYSVAASVNGYETEERAAAKMIKHIIDTERAGTWFNADAGEEQRVKYSDIAILSRKKKGQISKTVAALAAEGVPVTSVSSVNVCDYAEVKTLMDILSLIDNAEQDIPLCSGLLSAMGDCTLDELAAIRLAYPSERFFRTACKRYAAEKNDFTAHKLHVFYARLEEARTLSTVLSAGELLTKIITDTNMEARVLSADNGASCLKRMHRFIEETSVEEPLSVHAFLQRLRNLDYEIPFNENAGEDSVKVLTMHSSKGLEYPVVIVDDLNAPFKGTDRDEAMIEEKYGLAPYAFDGEKMLRKDTLLRRLHAYKQTENSIADELNLYYVALTRAKDTLHLLFKNSVPLPDVKYAKSFADFTDFSVWEKYVVQDEIFDVPKQERDPLVFRPDEALAKNIMDAFLWEYPHAACANLPVKSSATQLLQEKPCYFAESENVNYTERDRAEENEVGVTGTERGVAYHAFLEYTDFSRLRADKARVTETVEQAVQCVRESGKADADLLDKEKCAEILSNDVFYRLRDKTLYKEQRFLAMLPVKDTYAKYNATYADLQNEAGEILFQGAIDLLAVGENEAWVIDYKYSLKNAERLKDTYLPQLALYRQAVAKILRLPLEKVHGCIVNIYHGFAVDVF